MRKCRHPKDYRAGGRHFVGALTLDKLPRLPADIPNYPVNVCTLCGKYLPLGPAAITPEVEVEARAAFLASLGEWESIRDAMTTGEYWGWHKAVSPHESDVVWFDEEPGYLARCIVESEES